MTVNASPLISEEDKLRILWNHYQKQVDENRAVSRHLEDLRIEMHKLRNRLKDLEDAQTRTNSPH